MMEWNHDAGHAPCCTVAVSYTYTATDGTTGTKSGITLEYHSSAAGACDKVVAGGKFTCMYKQAAPYETIEHIDT